MGKYLKKITTSRYYANIFKLNSDKIAELKSILEDEQSRKTLDGVLKAYKSIFRKPEFYFAHIAASECNNYHFTTDKGFKVYGTENPYFLDDIFSINKKMVYLDGGAYVGDTIQLLFKLLGEPCEYTYAFEPNDVNFQKLTNAVKNFDNFVHCFEVGLDNHNGIVSFIDSDSGSRISEEGTVKITVIDAKEFLYDLRSKCPSFIKLDIEGKEPDVLAAMSDYISTNSPDLAISVYHKLEDLWEIPLQIHHINSEYKIFLRHQSNYFTETVCYATKK